jgi:GT2 family glycosyltransferase
MTIALSIVMPCHNRRDALRLTLESLCKQASPSECFEVIVVDQASSDGSRELVRSFASPFQLRLLEQDRKYGISMARNAGSEAASSQFVLLLDADLIANPGVVGAHVACHANHTEVLGCGQVKPYPPVYASYIEEVANPDAGLDRGEQSVYLPFYQGFGGHLSYSKDAFYRIGPFDPSLKGYEDIDFAYRADKLGFKLYNCKEAVGYHNHPRTIQERYEQARAYNRMLPVLLERYPELKGVLPIFKDLEPINWQKDNLAQLKEKFRVRALGFPPIRGPALLSLNLLNRYRLMPWLARGLFWQLLMGSWYLGYRDGAAQLRTSSQR